MSGFERDVFMEAAAHHRQRGYSLVISAVLVVLLVVVIFLLRQLSVFTVIVPGAADSRRIPIEFRP